MKGKNNPGRGLSSKVRITNTIPFNRAENQSLVCMLSIYISSI